MKFLKQLAIVIYFTGLPVFVSATSQSGPLVRVEPVEGGLWRAIYELGFPVEELRFNRHAGFQREAVWAVKTPGYEFAQDGGTQALVRREGFESASTITFEFSVNTRFIVADYSFFNRFSDGGLAIYTGHFFFTPIGPAVPDHYRGAIVTEVQITPPPGQRIGVYGQLSEQTLKTVDATGEGTFAYIGVGEAVVDDHMLAIVDKGLPDWVAKDILQRMPALLEYYNAAMGEASPRKPLMLLSYEPEHELPYSWDGGARRDMVQLRLQGQGWATKDPEKEAVLWRFLAHEVAHLWAGQAAQPEQDTPPWIHEGAADALAEMAAEDLGWASRESYSEQIDTALNKCIQSLQGKALNRLPEGSYSTNYVCGHVMALWSDAALRQADLKSNLFDLWQLLIQKGTYSESSYLTALEALGASTATTSAMRAFAGSAQEDPGAVLASGFAKVGLPIVLGDVGASRAASFEASAQVLWALLATDCAGGHGFYREGELLQLAGLGECQRAQEGMQVTHMAGTAVGDPGFAAYHRVKETCERKGRVRITNVLDQGVELACPQQLPKPVWWRFVKRKSV